MSIKNQKLTFDHRILLLALFTGFPGAVVALCLLWFGNYSSKVQWTLTLLILLFWIGLAFSLWERIIRPLQTISNLLSALREGDFSFRGRGACRDDALGEVFLEINTLATILQDQRMEALEASALLRTVMAELDVAIFTFDQKQRLRLINRAGERLLAQPAERILGLKAEELGLAECFQQSDDQTWATTFPGGTGRFSVRRSTFREKGIPHQLLVLSDVSRPLREEERLAWQRLIRVLGHELNNSLAPIKSIAGSLVTLVTRNPLPEDWQEDVHSGLSVIASRSEALSRFMQAYARLARLPQPQFKPVEVSPLVKRVVGLETRLAVEIEPGPELVMMADGDQLEQLLINLLRNAVDASLETGGGVKIGWKKNLHSVEFWIVDEGPGLANTTNLFVPFFTTKPGGSGIGLVLSRQIAEAHGGTITLENRTFSQGCEARLRLPFSEN